MPSYFNAAPQRTEKLIAAASYLTWGMAGLIYMLVSGRRSQSQFFRFHFLQAILLSIFTMLLGWALSAFGSTVGGLFGLMPGSAPAQHGLGMGISVTSDLIHLVTLIIQVLGIIQSLRGKFLEVPLLSRLVHSNMGRW
jgi:uncharacterized membrane protein